MTADRARPDARLGRDVPHRRLHARGATDESPGRSLIQRLTTAYLRSALHPEDTGWQTVATALEEDTHPLGKLQSK